MTNPDEVPSNIRLTVSMPYWRSRDYVRRSVDSILDQTYKDFRLIVVNDGGSNEDWAPLEDIEDPRLIRFDLSKNRGRYYADAVTLGACDTKWWSPHDSDDVSVPDRFEKLLNKIGDREAVFSPTDMIGQGGSVKHLPVRTDRLGRPSQPRLTTVAKYPAGIYRTDAARKVGGPHPGIRGSYDTTFVSLMWHAFKPLPVVDESLYIVHKRPGSLTTDKRTHLNGEWRKDQRKRRRRLFREAITKPLDQWAEALRPKADLQAALTEDIERLRSLL